MKSLHLDYNVTIIKNGGNGNNVDVELHVISWTEQRGRLGEIRETKRYTQGKTFRKRRSESLYLGGAPIRLGVDELTGGLYANGFKGCISHLEIRKRVRENPPKSFGGIIDLKTNVDNKNVLNWNGVSCEETCSI